jgi:hypothetical protein
MTTTRSLTLVFAAAAAVSAAGCGSKCHDSTPAVSAAPTACTAPAGAPVTVPVHVCPSCDQSMPTCDVRSQGGTFVLEPVSQVCDQNPSCPIVDPSSCPFQTMDCQFTAPTPTDVSTFPVVIVTSGPQVQFTLTVSGTGTTPVRCSVSGG